MAQEYVLARLRNFCNDHSVRTSAECVSLLQKHSDAAAKLMADPDRDAILAEPFEYPSIEMQDGGIMVFRMASYTPRESDINAMKARLETACR